MVWLYTVYFQERNQHCTVPPNVDRAVSKRSSLMREHSWNLVNSGRGQGCDKMLNKWKIREQKRMGKVTAKCK